MRRPRPGRVQAEPAEKAEAIQHLRALGEPRHRLVVRLLIQIQPRLVPAYQVHCKLQSVQFDGHRSGELAGQHAVGLVQPLELARRHVAALEDGPRRQSTACSAATIVPLRGPCPARKSAATSTSSYLSTISPLRKSLSALTTRNEVAAGRCR